MRKIYFKNKNESSLFVIKYINFQIFKREDSGGYTIYFDECLIKDILIKGCKYKEAKFIIVYIEQLSLRQSHCLMITQ